MSRDLMVSDIALSHEKWMQGNTRKACIHAPAPYLSHLLKPDNLAPICNNDSDQALH